ncbi:Lrp/AsnC family transcriptional regulator [Nocardia bovistercoris]|uniref:AsnC family transcriptional regulator n=1 Tax=Nocardia bovistercoris TaxID=2785916 RepID=A0A931IGT6_9NOCA|nr:AsnC family transcriptional regulator [Nocardia bovistercoris]MBH0779403.1 AsnC family transcriptional regulator [Nocardia bovistercoris]
MTVIDELDRGIVHALHIDGRAPFSRIGTVLGVSTQTVARRYRRMRTQAGLRVIGAGHLDRDGHTRRLVRLGATPAAARTLAQSLARRPDTSWIKLLSGGTEILLIVRTPRHADAADSLLLHEIPRTAAVTSVSAHYVLHTYLGGPTPWHGQVAILTEHQTRQLEPRRDGPVSGRALSNADNALVTALQADGRAGLTELATATGWSSATVARRLADLRAREEIFFDVQLDDTHFGITTRALLWMSVPSSQLDRAGAELAEHPELAFVLATTGPNNLVAQVMCPDPGALHHYLTRRLGGIAAIRTPEVTPVLATIKAAGRITAELPEPPRATHHRRVEPR